MKNNPVRQKEEWEKEWSDLLDRWGIIPTPLKGARKHTREMRKAWTDFIRQTRLDAQREILERVEKEVKQLSETLSFTGRDPDQRIREISSQKSILDKGIAYGYTEALGNIRTALDKLIPIQSGLKGGDYE